MDDKNLDRVTQIAYEAFLTRIVPFAPSMMSMPMEWGRLPETLKQAWRNAVQAAFAAATTTDA